MPNIETIIKAEITRLAKKEANQAFSPLAGEVRSMKKKLSDLSKKFAPLEKWTRDKMRQTEEKKAQLKAPADEVKKSRLSPRWIRNLRQKLGLSQNKLAILVGASLGTVAMWEKGNFSPRKDKKAALIALRKLGKREVKKVLEKKKAEIEEKKPKRRKVKKAAKKKAGNGRKVGVRGKRAGKVKRRKK